jgi:spore coat polysaccharide biosynthesis protein SpsF (cytidylyltransferase family)
LDVFVRVCGDSPMLDQKLIDQGVKLFNGEYDLVTNTLPRSYPVGQSVEVIRTSTFEKVYEKMSRPDHFEHVTKYFYENSDEFRIKNFSNDKDLSSYRLVVDTPEDLKRIEKIIGSMTRPHTEYSFDDFIELYPSS